LSVGGVGPTGTNKGRKKNGHRKRLRESTNSPRKKKLVVMDAKKLTEAELVLSVQGCRKTRTGRCAVVKREEEKKTK